MSGAILPDVRLQNKEFGKPLELESFRGRINTDFYQPDFIKKISKFDQLLQETSHQVLFADRNRIRVIPFPLPEGKTVDIAVKEFFPRGLNRLKTIFLASKAWKAWRGGVVLMEKDILTPVPVAYLEKRKFFFIDESCYLTVLVKEVEEIRQLFRRLSPEKLSTLLRALALHLRRCHKEGILHRDLSDGNILVKKDVQDGHIFFLIDTNRIRFKKKLNILQRIKNIVRLGVPREFQKYFLKEYTKTDVVKKWAWFWYRFSKQAYTWRINLKKRLNLGRRTKTGYVG